MAFLLVGFFILLLYLSKYFISLVRNYVRARKTGLPLIIVPIDPNNLLWMIVSVPLRPVIKRYAPSSIYLRIAMTIYGWEYHEKRIIFRTLNTDSFMLVTCGRNEFFTIDPEAVVEVCKRSNEFDKSPHMKDVANVFGPSLFTSVGDAWSRQRKLITGIINERISQVVFEETWRQSRAMVSSIENQAADNVQAQNCDNRSTYEIQPEGIVYDATFPSMKRIASNVLSFSAYGIPQPFVTPPKHNVSATRKLDMIECINVVIANLIIAAFIPAQLMSRYPLFLPGATLMRSLYSAMVQYPEHVTKRLDDERQSLRNASTQSSKSNLTSMLIQSSQVRVDNRNPSEDSEASKIQHYLSLSESELRGNLFIFTTAGFETTANALTYALVALMAEPKWQEWISEEIDELFNDNEVDGLPDYASFYPKAFRCLALMMEVLRLYPPLVHLARCTPENSHAIIKTSRQTYNLPPDCHVYIPFISMHTNPSIWRNLNAETSSSSNGTSSNDGDETVEDVFTMRQDEYVFRPSRWINRTNKSLPDGTMMGTLFQPPRGSYMPFSGGPRICPGQKMAQVEFVSVVLALFSEYRIEAVRNLGESDIDLYERMQGLLRDSHAEITMVMERLGEVEVKFVKRKQRWI